MDKFIVYDVFFALQILDLVVTNLVVTYGGKLLLPFIALLLEIVGVGIGLTIKFAMTTFIGLYALQYGLIAINMATLIMTVIIVWDIVQAVRTYDK